MLAILIFLYAHNLPIFQPILMILVSKFMVHRALSVKTYLSLWLLSPLRQVLLYYKENRSINSPFSRSTFQLQRWYLEWSAAGYHSEN